MIGTDEISGPGDGEHGVSVAPMPGDPQKPVQEPPPAPPAEDPSAKVYKYMSGQFDVGTPQEFKEVLKDPEKRKKVYDYMSSQYDVGTQEEFDKKLAPPADHQLDHSAVSDLRFLQGQVNNNPEVQLPGGMAKQTDIDPAFATKQKDLQDQADKKMLDVASDFNADPRDVQTVMQDFPYENDSSKLKEHLQMMKENPVTYSRFVAKDQNRQMIGAVSIHAANEYNNLDHVNDLEDLQNNIAYQKSIINNTLVGDQRDKALKNLEIDRAPNFNGLNPLLIQRKATIGDQVGDLDNNQYAALEELKTFDPGKYELWSNILKNTTNEKELSPDMKIGVERIKKSLLDTGRQNTLNYLQEQQHVLDDKWKNAQTDQDKEPLAEQFKQNNRDIEAIHIDQQNDRGNFPYLNDQEFDQQARELMGATGEHAGFTGSLARGIGKFATSVPDIVMGWFSNSKDKAQFNAASMGASDWEASQSYLPESLRRKGSPVVYQFDKPLQEAAEKIKSDKSLTDDQKISQVNDLVRNNQEKVHTVTNPNAGKGSNFFSKSTYYSNAQALGNIVGIATEQAGLEGAGLPKLLASVAPMFMNTVGDYTREGVQKGIANPGEYGLSHGLMASAIGLINPDFDVIKRSVGLTSPLGKAIADGTITKAVWNDFKYANKQVINKFKNAAIGATKEAAKLASIQGGGTELGNYLVNKGLFNDKTSLPDAMDKVGEAMKNSVIDFVGLLGLHGVMNLRNVTPAEKGMVWEAGQNPKISAEKIDWQVKNNEISAEVGEQRKQTINDISKLISKVPQFDAKGKPLTDQQRSDYLYNLVIKDKATKLKGDLPEVHAENLANAVDGINISNGQIIDPASAKKAVATGLANVKIPEGSPLNAYEGKGPEIIKMIQQHVTGSTDGEAVGEPAKLPAGMFPEHLVEAAVRLLPDEEKRRILQKYDEQDIYPSAKLEDWLSTPKIEEPSKTAPTVVMPGENKSPQVVPLKETPPERIVKTTSVAGEEPTLPKGETPVTLSGMTESERQEAITQRRSKTELPDEVKWENGIHDTLGRMDKMKPSERRDAADQIRQEVRKKNAELGFEKYKYSTGILSRRVAVRSGFRKGQQIWRRSRPKFLETGNQSIVDKGTVLRDRSPELQHHFEELSDVAEHLDIPDASNNKMLSKEQINSAIQDIHDGIPSVQAESVLNVLEKGVREDAFPVKEAPGGSLNMNELTGAEKEVTGEPFDKGNLIKWLNDESTLTPEHEEVLHDNIENLLHDYSTEDIPESQISGADALAKKGTDTKVKSGAGDETKIAKPGETKAAVAKLEIEREASMRNPKPKAELPFVSVDDIVSKSNSPEEMKQKQDAIKDKQTELRKILDCLYN